MNNVSDRLVNYYPRTWETTNYDGKLYVLKPVLKNSHEFISVANKFPRAIETLCRIQNPLAYLRYILHGEHLVHLPFTTSRDHIEQIVYHPVFSEDAESAMMYNCDRRHYLNPQGNFFINPAHLPTAPGNYFIVLKKRGNIDEATFTKNHFPMYLITTIN